MDRDLSEYDIADDCVKKTRNLFDDNCGLPNQLINRAEKISQKMNNKINRGENRIKRKFITLYYATIELELVDKYPPNILANAVGLKKSKMLSAMSQFSKIETGFSIIKPKIVDKVENENDVNYYVGYINSYCNYLDLSENFSNDVIEILKLIMTGTEETDHLIYKLMSKDPITISVSAVVFVCQLNNIKCDMNKVKNYASISESTIISTNKIMFKIYNLLE